MSAKMDALHERIATTLGWELRDVRTFSLPMLREIAKTKHPQFADEITKVIENGDHIIGDALKPKRRLR